jgi:Na+-translocating ferredoxin:NAD+ oxidoreductase RnfG subunit
VVYTNDLDIRHVQVLRYREQIGGAVQNQQWLKQFRGTSPESSFERGKDVDGITGATISVDALISGLKRMSVYLSLIKGDLTNHERK